MSTSTALVTLDNMPAPEARLLHMEVKNRGRGELTKFIKYETAHTRGQYYYRLRKKGVMPFKKTEAGNKNTVVSFKSSRNVADPRIQQLEAQIKQLELQLEAANVTPAQRALDVLAAGMGEISYRSRVFLAQLIAKDYASISHKQEKWLADLESKHL
jgi:hypothetical protein